MFTRHSNPVPGASPRRLAISLVAGLYISGVLALGTLPLRAAEASNVMPDKAAAGGQALGVPSGTYGLDKTHGYITFGYSHLGFSNPEVGFNDFDVALTLDAQAPQNSTFEVVIQAASIDSRVAKFDEHLIGPDYFDVATHKTIRFVSSAIQMTSANTADITGMLTLKGQSHPVALSAVLNKAGIHPLARVPALGVSASATLKRSQWGLDKYVPMVSDEVEVRIEIELPKAK